MADLPRKEISVADARRFVLDSIAVLPAETVFLLDARERVLAEDLIATRPIPPWDNSAMDGFAVRAEDVRPGATLAVQEEILAGALPAKKVGAGQASKIMTGAPLPEGADTVVPVELTKASDAARVTLGEGKLPAKGEHVRRAGEDVRAGETVVPRGTHMSPAAIGVAASLGRATLAVHQRPRVAVLSTGDEIAEVGTPAHTGQIYTSNSYTLAAAILRAGGIPTYLGIAADTREDLHAKLAAARTCDMLLTTGGVSVGDADFVKEVLSSLGAEMQFWRVAQRPGYPLAYGVIGGTPVFGLPGNPVATMVSFEQYVQPALRKMQGERALFPPVVSATLEEDVVTRPGKHYFLRAILTRGEAAGELRVRTTGGQSSGMLTSLLRANGLILVPPDRSGAKKGERVQVQIIDPSFWLGEHPGF